jgi:hypothetical protein
MDCYRADDEGRFYRMAVGSAYQLWIQGHAFSLSNNG